MGKQAPRVSIGLPVYNGENYLGEALDSLLRQSFRDFELIISDNASEDNTQEICQRYAAADSRIRYERLEENVGAIPNFNRLFALRRGEYFKWAAHDDVCQPTFLQRCVDMLDAHPEVIWCHSTSDMIDADGRSWIDQIPEDAEPIERRADGTLWWKGLPRADFNAEQPHRRYAGVLLGTNWCVDFYGLIRASALRRTELLAPIYGSEKVLVGQLALQGKYRQVPECLFAQRIHAEASSSLDGAGAEQLFVAQRSRNSFLRTRWLLLSAHCHAIRTSDLSRWERMKAYSVVLRYVMQTGKWGQITRKLVQGGGVGGDGRRMLEARRPRRGRVKVEH